MKKQSDLSRLMGYAGNHRYFTYASWVLSAVSALVALVPFVYIWKILRDVLNAAPNYAQAVNIPHYGWMAVLFAVLSYLIYIAALMCSHLSAFRVATNLRLAVSEHLAVLPLGFAENFGSGKLRKIIHESTGAAETYLAHQLPDQYNAIATLFNGCAFGPPLPFTATSTWTWVDHPVSGLLLLTSRPLKTWFPFGSTALPFNLASQRNSPDRSTKSTRLSI